jgi:hypothetical protein
MTRKQTDFMYDAWWPGAPVDAPQSFDAQETVPQGCGPCHDACACREAQMEAIVDAANRAFVAYTDFEHNGFDVSRQLRTAVLRLDTLVRAWHPANKAAMEEKT